jgi:hypothetical protein
VEQIESTQEVHTSVINTLAEEIEDMKRLPEPEHRPIGFQTAWCTLDS